MKKISTIDNADPFLNGSKIGEATEEVLCNQFVSGWIKDVCIKKVGEKYLVTGRVS